MIVQLRPPVFPQAPRRFAAMLRRGDDVRASKVRDIRRRIRNGTYDEPFKLAIAVNRLVEHLME